MIDRVSTEKVRRLRKEEIEDGSNEGSLFGKEN